MKTYLLNKKGKLSVFNSETFQYVFLSVEHPDLDRIPPTSRLKS